MASLAQVAKDLRLLRVDFDLVRKAASGGGGGGVTDHGALTGLADNDHPQYELSGAAAAAVAAHEAAGNPHPVYLTAAEGNAAYDALGAAAAAQAASQPLDADLTAIAALTTTAHGRGLLDDADAAASRVSIGAAATSHSHAQSDVTNLTSDLALKAPLASPTFTGTVTVPDASFTNAKLANMAANTVKANATAGSAAPADLAMGASTIVARLAAGNIVAATPTEITALLNAFTSALKGLVPASGGGTTNFLRADGTWNAPGGGSSAWTTLKQTADDSKTDNTLASSTFLTVALAASTRYTIRGTAFILVQNASADARFDINYSGTWTTVYCRDTRNVAGVAAGTDARTDRVASALPASTDVLATATGIVIVEFEITGLTNGAGTLAFRFAQVTNNASATLLKAGSFMEYMTS